VGVSLDNWQITLIKLVGTASDTREDAVRCAATFATWQAITATTPLPPLRAVFDDHGWSIPFPRAGAGAVQGTSR
jgi:hypothetical protein